MKTFGVKTHDPEPTVVEAAECYCDDNNALHLFDEEHIPIAIFQPGCWRWVVPVVDKPVTSH